MVLQIPLRENDSLVEIDEQDLEGSFTQILELLETERCPLSLFTTFAIEYEKLGLLDHCMKLLEQGLKLHQSGKKGDLVALNPLAATYLRMASAADKKTSSDYLDKVTELYNLSDSIDIHEEKTWLGKGIVLLLRRSFERALFQFDTLLERQPHFVPALLGKALAYYRTKDFKESLKFFAKTLSVAPQYPYSRYGMGICFLELKMWDSAKKCFARVLNIDVNHIPSKIALGIIELHSKDPELIHMGAIKMKEVFQIDKGYPSVLNELASHFFFRKEFQKAEKLLSKALALSDIDESKSESCYILGKIHHVEQRYDEAFRFYSQSLKLNPDMKLSKLGLVQINMHHENFATSLKLLSEFPESDLDKSFLLKKIWGCLLFLDGRSAKASDHLNQVLKDDESDLEARLMLTKCLEDTNVGEALKEYDWLFKNHKELVSSLEYLNNYSCLLFKAGRHEESLKCFQDAQEKVSNLNSAQSILTTFNLGCSLDEYDKYAEASERLKSVLEKVPSFVYAHLRLGLSCQKQGKLQEAIDHFNDAIGINIEDEDESLMALLCLAGLQMKMKNYVSCRKNYEKILINPKYRHNQYALVALGNLHWKMGLSMSGKSRDDNLKRAGEIFQKALELESKNLFAANGLGVVLGSKKLWTEARDIFLSCKQDCALIDLWLNLAISYMELGQYASSINCLDFCIGRAPKSLLFELRLLKAKCHYCQGKAERASNHFENAIKELEEAKETPTSDNSVVTFNIALSKQEFGAMILKKGFKMRSTDDLTTASRLLEESHLIMVELSKKLAENSPLDRKLIEQRIEYGKQCQESYKLQLERQYKEEEQKRLRMEELKQAREEQLEKERLEEEEKEKIRLAKEAELEQKRQEMELKRKETIEILQQQKELRKVEKPPKSRKRAKLEEEDDDDNMDVDEKDLHEHRNLDNQLNRSEIEKEDEDEESRRQELLGRLREMKRKT